MRKLFLALCVASTTCAWPQSYTVETVPNVKVESNRYVSSPDGILDDATVRRIDQQLRDLEEKTSVQIAVVALSSIGDQDIFTFAQELFTRWGIGQASTDNGLLILLVLDQRTVRIHTGQGLEGMLPDVVCKRIEEEYMVPEFKEGRNSEGMQAGVDQVIKILSDPVYAKELQTLASRSGGWDIFFRVIVVFGALSLFIVYAMINDTFSDSKKPVATSYPEMRQTKAMWIVEFGIIPGAILAAFQFSPMDNPILEALAALYLYFLITLFHKRIRMTATIRPLLVKREYKLIVDFLEEYRVGWLVYGILYPVPFLPLYFLYRSKLMYYRNHPRNCQTCGNPAHKVDERTDDNYLSKEKAFEESLKSVDYDVWLCDSCGGYFELVYQNRFSKYDDCPKCKAKAFYLKGNRTVVSPTRNSKGKGEKTYECKFCSHVDISTYSIATLSDSSSASSPSRGSFGGGRSGGGGASTSW